MKIAGNKQHACLSGIVMAALILVGLNTYQFMSLQQQPLEGYSRTIKTLQTKLRQFDRRLAAGDFEPSDRIDLLGAVKPSPVSQHPKNDWSKLDPQKESQSLVAKAIGLPILSGIMHITGPRGTGYFQAVLDGRLCREKDTISGFIVAKISSAGVVVRRSGLNWTIECPTPYFSNDRGN